MRLRCAHEIPMSAEAFWGMIHAPAYEKAVAEAIGLQAYEELERREEPEATYRRIRVEVELPEPLSSLLRRFGASGPLGYVEEQWRRRDRRDVRWRMTPGALADRARIEGVVRVEAVGPARCRRVLDGVVELRVFGAGPLLERAVVARVTEAYARGAEVAARLAGGAGD